jgi:hypothetical protein
VKSEIARNLGLFGFLSIMSASDLGFIRPVYQGDHFLVVSRQK